MNQNINLNTVERGFAYMNIRFRYRTARSLCAVFLVAAILFFLVPPLGLQAEDETKEDPADNGEQYVYAVEIEFGSFAFYYDWGTWNVNTFSYEADPNSLSPAADTVSGKAGWYSFDGVNNKIRVTNYTITDTQMVEITIQFSDTSSADYDHFPLEQGCIKMDFYDTQDFANRLNSADNSYAFSMEKDASQEIYLSISGKPITVDGQPYMSATAQRIGYLTISVGLTDYPVPET